MTPSESFFARASRLLSSGVDIWREWKRPPRLNYGYIYEGRFWQVDSVLQRILWLDSLVVASRNVAQHLGQMLFKYDSLSNNRQMWHYLWYGKPLKSYSKKGFDLQHHVFRHINTFFISNYWDNNCYQQSLPLSLSFDYMPSVDIFGPFLGPPRLSTALLLVE